MSALFSLMSGLAVMVVLAEFAARAVRAQRLDRQPAEWQFVVDLIRGRLSAARFR